MKHQEATLPPPGREDEMAVKDISDKQVCEAYRESKATLPRMMWPYEILMAVTGQSEKVCFRAMERADRHGLVDYGTSLRSGWLTGEGKRLVAMA